MESKDLKNKGIVVGLLALVAGLLTGLVALVQHVFRKSENRINESGLDGINGSRPFKKKNKKK